MAPVISYMLRLLSVICLLPKTGTRFHVQLCPRIHRNTFQDLPRLDKNADNTERYILHDIRVTNINKVKFIDK
jgi:hypothetical protein